jgi:hypothetical protein
MNPRSPLALIQMLDRAGAGESGESHRQTGTEVLVGRKDRLSTMRNGALDLMKTGDPHDHGQNPKAIMKTSEKEIKGGRWSLIPAQAKICKTFSNPERVKHQSKQGRTRAVRGRRKMRLHQKGS